MEEEVIKAGLPEHIGIILDGNRRWAKSKGLNKNLGHSIGAKNLKRMARYANKIGIHYMTVYAFSTENWKREQEEVKSLMSLMEKYIEEAINTDDLENVKMRVIGDISLLSEKMQNKIEQVMEKTKNNTGLTLNIAFNYGGRNEIVRAVKKIAEKVKQNVITIDEITEQMISDNLYTAGQPDPDLIIRTSGEIRTSNFLPWQIVYSEFYFPEKHWPEFREKDLLLAIQEYQNRNRRFGGK